METIYYQNTFILKADDFGRNGVPLDQWRRFIDISLNYNNTVSIGVVTKELTLNSSAPKYLRAIHEEYGIEVWNHSHGHQNITRLSEKEIILDIEQSQKIIFEEIGVVPNIFGSPFNKIDRNSAEAINKLNCFDGYYGFDNYMPAEKTIALKYLCSAELGTDKYAPLRYSEFEKNAVSREWPNFLILQIHPYYWNADSFLQFDKILKQLSLMNYNSITAIDRVEYWAKRLNKLLPMPGRSMADNILHEESTLGTIYNTDKLPHTKRWDSSYYTRQIDVGTEKIYIFLRKLGFHRIPRKNDLAKIIDIGAGVGNWSLAASLLPNTNVIAIDIDRERLSFIANNENHSDNISILISNFFEYQHQSNDLSAAICNNTINYMDTNKVFRALQNSLIYNGIFYLGLQNRLYPLKDSISSVGKKDLESAKAFLDRLILNEGCCSGINIKTSIRYYNGFELDKISISCGLKLMMRDISPPLSFGSLGGKKTFSSHLFQKTSAAEKLMSSEQPDPLLRTYEEIAAFIDPNHLNSKYIESEDAARLYVVNAISKSSSFTLDYPTNGSINQAALFFNSLVFEVTSNIKDLFKFDCQFYSLIQDLYYAVVERNLDACDAASKNIEIFLSGSNLEDLGYWQ